MSKTLNEAKKNKIYTFTEDIDKEVSHYKEFFKGKSVYCPCDNPYKSNFYKYFKDNFEELGLIGLVATCYIPNGHGILAMMGKDGERIVYLEEDGNCFSSEIESLYRHADIIVTNPPFSQFRAFITMLIEMDRHFLILGSNNILTTKDMFNYVLEGKVWLGYGVNKEMKFYTPYEEQHTAKVNGISWFTNIPHTKEQGKHQLFKFYTDSYQKYDNYDSINVDKIADIPVDYDGILGVPITILGFISQGIATFIHDTQTLSYELIGIDRQVYGKRFTINNKEMYARVLIKRIK